MSIMVFLGLYSLCFFAFSEFQKKWTELWESKRQQFQPGPQLENQILKLFLNRFLWACSFGSWITLLEDLKERWNKDPKYPRMYWLTLALSPCALWPVKFFIFGFLNWNYYFFLGFAAILILLIQFIKNETFKKIFYLLFFVGLYGLGLDLMMKSAMLFQNWSVENGLAFILADGTFANLVNMFVFGLLMGIVFQGQVSTLPFILVLMMTNQLAMNAAVALLAGDFCGALLRLLVREVRQQSPAQKSMVTWLSCILISILFGFLMFGYAKESLEVMSEMNAEWIQPKGFILWGGFALLILPAFVVGCLLGHFRYKKTSMWNRIQ